MSEDGGPASGTGGVPDSVPAAVSREGTDLSLVWVIPVVAIVIGAWIGLRAISEQGPVITIEFKSAEGIEAGQTRVAFKDLQVGRVTGINLSDDLSHVLVTAELVRDVEDHLTENTRFWVVRPQVTAGRITGLTTLLSGAFIAMDPVSEGEPQEHFVGLETPPVVTTGAEGSIFTLRSEALGSIDVGAPVYYRQIQVGEVSTYEMDESGQSITTQVFVRAPHDARVRSNTRFWNASGLDVTIDAEGVRIQSSSIVAMLIGGIAFDSPDPFDPGEPVDESTVFNLYASKEQSEQPVYSIRQRYLLHFPHSVQGLAPGSPVVFRGIKIGRVVDVNLQLDPTTFDVRVPVVIEVEPERLEIPDSDQQGGVQGRIERLVANGLRAQLGRGNLLTGALQVELDVHKDEPPARVVLGGRYAELPTIPAPLDEITASVSGVLAKIDRLPLDQIGSDLSESMAELRDVLKETNQLAAGFNEDLIPALSSTLGRLDSTVGSLDELLADDAPLPLELRRALEDVGEAARSVRVLADYLEQHPEAMIRGR